MIQVAPTVLLAILVVAVMPIWPYSRGWGWPWAGILGMGLATMIVFSLTVAPS